ncbi:lipocalin family protein [Hymenobacter fastidiosus]|uniref:Lipocalin family protein n=1 Tax=Hymenobacter fastidiosus TaxID=486264 RepID=A0ABP7S8F7_9BACT
MAKNLLHRRQPVLFTAAAALLGTGVAAFVYARRKLLHPLPTVPHVELKRYMGLWYEVARLPTRYEKDCQHVTAEYRLMPDGKVSILNTCHKHELQGPIEKVKGTARVVDAETNAKLKVSFFWPFEGDYWILDLDYVDYQYALVGEPGRKNLWLLSRKPHLDRTFRDQLVARGRELGFPTENLIFTGQPVIDKP